VKLIYRIVSYRVNSRRASHPRQLPTLLVYSSYIVSYSYGRPSTERTETTSLHLGLMQVQDDHDLLIMITWMITLVYCVSMGLILMLSSTARDRELAFTVITLSNPPQTCRELKNTSLEVETQRSIYSSRS